MTKKLDECALAPAQEVAWRDTRAALTWNCPAFTHILFSMLNNANSRHIAMFTKDVPIAATDGSNLLLNPDTFFKYKLNERVFIVAHEIMHCIWNHCGLMHTFQKRGQINYPDGTSLPYDQQTMNIATDLVINDCLIESQVGAYNSAWLHDTNYAVAKDSAIDAYKKVFQQQQGGGGRGPDGASFDEHLEPGTSEGKDPSQAVQERSEIEWQTQVAAAMHAARVQGKLPASLDRLFTEVLNPAVDWKDKIAALFARKVGTGSYDWATPDNELIVRDIYAPARAGFGAGTVVVGVDTSGSVGSKELDMFFAEISGILEDVRPKQLLIMWCDASVHRVDELDDPSDLNWVRSQKAPGGGGTAFEPVFSKIEELHLEPEALVYLTDGCGSFPTSPAKYPVIWGNISPPNSVSYPFGDVVDVPKQAA